MNIENAKASGRWHSLHKINYKPITACYILPMYIVFLFSKAKTGQVPRDNF